MRKSSLLFFAAFLSASLLLGTPSYAIFGGFEIKPSEVRGASRLGFLIVLDGANGQTCTGTLINSRTILTAAHCLTKFRPLKPVSDLTVLFMTSDLKIHKVIDGANLTDMYPSGKLLNQLGQIADLSLLLLEEPATGINPDDSVDLAGSDDAVPGKKIRNTFAYGYGQAEPGKEVDLLRGRTIWDATPALPEDSHDAITAHNPSHGSMCHGDSGGPLIIYERHGGTTKAKLIGVLSQLANHHGFFGRLFESKEPCLAADTEYWTSVAPHRAWISHTTLKLYQDHGITEDPGI